jgi:hypothetical protein
LHKFKKELIMPDTWNPFKPAANPDATANEPKPGEKSPAELIAESVGKALEPVVSRLGEFTTRLDAIETATRRPPKTEEPVQPHTIPSVFDDEDGAFAHRVGPVVQRQLETEARIARNEIKQDYVARGYAEVYTQFESEINQILDNSPLVDGKGQLCRGSSQYINNVVEMVFGRAAMKQGIKFGGKDKGFFIESAGGSSTTTTGVPANDGLTDGQRKVFARMGIKAEDGAKTKSKLQFVN